MEFRFVNSAFANTLVRSFFIEVVFLRRGGVFRLKHHLKPKKAEIIGVVFLLGGVFKFQVEFL